jgi:hypothetical protein
MAPPSVGGNAQEDGAQHQEDQQQRRDQHKGHALGQLGQQAQLEDPVERGDHEGDEGAAAHGGDDLLVGGDFGDFLALPPGVQVGHVARKMATMVEMPMTTASEV